MCGPLALPKTLILHVSMTKICNFSYCYPVWGCCGWHSCSEHNLRKIFVNGLINNDEKGASSKNECKDHSLFLIKMDKIDTLFMTKTAKKPYPLGPHIPGTIYTAYIREDHPPPPPFNNVCYKFFSQSIGK